MIGRVISGMRWRSGLTYNFLSILSILYSASAVRDLDLFKILFLAFFLLLSVRIAFLVNNLYDLKEDEIHPNGLSKNPFIGLSDREIYSMKILSYVFTLTLFLLFLVIFKSIIAGALYGTLLLLDLTYSAPPRWKEKPPLDVLSHSLYFGSLIFAIPLFIFGLPLTLSITSILVGLAFMSIVLELGNHIRDYKFDMGAGASTFVTKYGLKVSQYTVKSSFILGFVFLTIPVFFTLMDYSILSIYLAMIAYLVTLILVLIVNEFTLSHLCGLIMNLLLIMNILSLLLTL